MYLLNQIIKTLNTVKLHFGKICISNNRTWRYKQSYTHLYINMWRYPWLICFDAHHQLHVTVFSSFQIPSGNIWYSEPLICEPCERVSWPPQASLVKQVLSHPYSSVLNTSMHSPCILSIYSERLRRQHLSSHFCSSLHNAQWCIIHKHGTDAGEKLLTFCNEFAKTDLK